MTSTNRHYFPADGSVIETEQMPNGYWIATEPATYDGPGSPLGWGFTQLAAIADLVDQLNEGT